MTNVLVGIPTLNGPDRLRRCLEAIAQCTRFNDFGSVKVLVCDDGSREEDLRDNKTVIHDAFERIKGLEMLTSDRRCGVAASWNKLVRHQYADVVVLMNDDVEVVDHWLDALVYTATRNTNIGMVSLNSYVGVTKEQAKCLPPRIDYRESKIQFGNGTLLASNGSIFAFRRITYDAVNGFDERYFCFYEEVDFGVSLKKAGFINAILSYPIVFHAGGATTSDAKNIIASEEIERSRQKFKEKWGASPDTLRKELTAPPPDHSHEWNTQLAFLKD